MNNKLTTKQIEYIFFHLNFYIELNSRLLSRFFYNKSDAESKKGVFFPLSDKSLDESNIKYIKDIPILFSLSTSNEFYFISDETLYFNDDLLKSAFYLLSGYQETLLYKGDSYGRFSYHDSIQKRLNIAEKPLVNIYFKIIEEAIEKFCKINNLTIRKRNLWGNKDFGFMLTHDVDRVDKYTIHKLKNTIKKFINLSKSEEKKRKLFKQVFIDIIYLLNGKNPYWNFNWMKRIEKKYKLKSTWYFLPRGELHRDAYYSFKEKRIQNLVKFLQYEGDEIGLHGVYESRLNMEILKKNYGEIRELIGEYPIGIRQHWLSFKFPETLLNMENIGFKYDSSWSFADHVGWRNSYCLPFRPWDFDNNRMMNIWELPLALMDVTLFEYQKMSYDEANIIIQGMLKQIKKYNGLFVTLWHNSLDEENNKGITEFYKFFLNIIAKNKPMIILPKKLLEIINGIKGNGI